MTDLIEAAKSGDASTVKALIDGGVDINGTDAEGLNALTAAAEAGNPEIVQTLIAAGADAKAGDADGWTALMSASAAGHVEIVQQSIYIRRETFLHDGLVVDEGGPIGHVPIVGELAVKF